MFRAQCVTVRDPFHPLRNREIRLLDGPGPISDLAPETKQPFIILRNGEAVLRADWDKPVADGDLLAVVLLPQDGDGGGSDVLKIVLLIVVIIVAWYAGPAVGALFGTSASTGTAIVGLVGSALVNVLVPPPSASVNNGGFSDAKSASPTYNLGAQGNVARLGGAIPIQYGRLNIYPDFAAAPYVEYDGNEQYLYQLLCIGVGEFDIEQIRIEDSDISSFEEISAEIIAPGMPLRLFPSAVSTSQEVSGQEMLTNVVIGPFVANPAGTAATKIALDMVCPRGLFLSAVDGSLNNKSISFVVEMRSVNDSGSAIGGWVLLASETVTAATSTPQRFTFGYAVSNGRYEVRVKRTDAKDLDVRAGHEIIWTGLRTHLVAPTVFGDVTLLAMRMRATNNLSAQASRKINVTCTRKVYRWTGGAWAGPEASRSPAWAIADACRTVGLPDSRIDLNGLLALDAEWSARGDRFDGRFDSTSTFWDCLTKIARAGRAKPYMQGGIVHVVRDKPAALPVALFSMRNIKRGSFSLNFITPTEDTADSVQVTYFDQSTWKERTLLCALPGSSADRPAKVDLFGVVDRQQAFREGIYMAAANRYRRTVIKFETEMEGFIPSYGDLVAINHDLPQWGQHAEAVAWSSAGRLLALSEPVTFGAGSHYVGLRRRDGSVAGPYSVEAKSPVRGSNMLVNSGFDSGIDGWGFGWNQSVADVPGVLSKNMGGAADNPSGINTIGLFRSGTPVGVREFGMGHPAYSGQALGALVTPGLRYCASARLAAKHCFVECFVIFLDDNLNQLGYFSIGKAGEGVGGSIGGNNLGSWDFRFAFGIAPVNAKRVWFVVRQSAAMAATVGASCWVAQPMIEMAATDQTAPSTWTTTRMSHDLELATMPDFSLYTGQSEERTHVTFGWGETWRQRALVVSCRPNDEYGVEIICISEDDSVHFAENGLLAPPVNHSQLPATPSAPSVVGLSVRSSPNDVTAMIISWQPSPGAEYYIIEQSADGVSWIRTAEPRASNFTATALYGGQTLVRVAAVGALRGAWAQVNYAIVSDFFWTGADTDLMWAGSDTDLMWG